MNLWDEIVNKLELTAHNNFQATRRRITGAYCGDLLSDVLANASPGNLWITIHRHRNIIAVAVLINLAGIIITGNRKPDTDTLEYTLRENIPLFTTPLDNFQASGRLYNILSRLSLSK